MEACNWPVERIATIAVNIKKTLKSAGKQQCCAGRSSHRACSQSRPLSSRLRIAAAIFALALAACASKPASQPAAEGSSTELVANARATLQPSATPTIPASATATSSPAPSASPVPTATPTGLPTATAVQTPTVTPTPKGGDQFALLTYGFGRYETTGDGGMLRLVLPSWQVRQALDLPDRSRDSLQIAPDGSHAAVTSQISVARPSRLFFFDLNLDQVLEFTGGDFDRYNWQWSPSGDHVLVIGQRPLEDWHDELFIMATTGESAGTLTHIGRYANRYATVWTPDGSALLLFQPGSAYRITPDGARQALPCSFCSQFFNLRAESAAFSPDGSRIAVIFSYPQEPGAETAQMAVANADLSAPQLYPLGVYSFGGAVWSPEGERILFNRYTINGTARSYTIGSVGTAVVNLGDGAVYKPVIGTQRRAGTAWPCGWSSDGRRIYVVLRLQGQGANLIAFDLETETEHEIVSGGERGLSCPQWLPTDAPVAP